jgi:hypothetical protein
VDAKSANRFSESVVLGEKVQEAEGGLHRVRNLANQPDPGAVLIHEHTDKASHSGPLNA